MATGPDIDSLSRSELVEKARVLGVERPERMTRVELRDEMIRRTVSEEDQAEARGLFGVARSMLASVVESGLKFPDAAKVIRGESSIQVPAANQTPVATVTLAEIYAAQGHQARALRMLEEVLREEPEHHEALRVRRELIGHDAPLSKAPESTPPPAPPVLHEIAATPEYVPGGFLDTTGEEIQTGKPPVVAVADASPAVQVRVEVEAQDEVEPATLLDQPEIGSDLEPQGEVHVAPPSEKVAYAPALVITQEKSSLTLYWELPPSVLEHCGVDLNDGGPAIRLVAFIPSGISPARTELTLELESTSRSTGTDDLGAGSRVLHEFGKPAVVRAALGWQSSDGFLPLSVGRSWDEWNENDEFAELLDRADNELQKIAARA